MIMITKTRKGLQNERNEEKQRERNSKAKQRMNRKRKENECRVEKEKDAYTFDPYNDANVEITAEDVTAMLKEYNVDVPITNFNLYRRAFIQSFVDFEQMS